MRFAICLAAFTTLGCLGGKRGGGPIGEDGEPESEPQCETSVGWLEGAVYYWGPPGDPDSIAADSVDVLLTQGGQTFRTGTTPLGTFSVPIESGAWTLAADDHSGCLSERIESVTVEPCEVAEVTLLIDLCSY